MELKLIDIISNTEVSKKSAPKFMVLKEIRFDIIKSVIIWQQNKARAGTHKVKTISEISGTTAKPYRQKGTGNARQGSRRATQFRGGATVFGPVPRTHNTKLPKKIKRLGLINSLAYHVKNKSLDLINDPKFDKPDTKKINHITDNNKSKILFIVTSETDQNFVKSIKNLKNINFLKAEGANVYDIMNHDKLYITESAINKLEERVSNAK
jgi:large subunit ribosomal protein L4